MEAERQSHEPSSAPLWLGEPVQCEEGQGSRRMPLCGLGCGLELRIC